MAPINTAERFVTLINGHDTEALAALMTTEHRFIDSLGSAVQGREQTKQSWRAYFEMVPDYRIAIAHRFVSADEVMLAGVAGGSFVHDRQAGPGEKWMTPAAFRAVIHEDRVHEWQVFADNEPIRRLIRRETTPQNQR